MLRCERYHPDTGAVESLPSRQVAALIAQPGTLLWIDLQEPTAEELQWLAETFHFHPLAMEDVQKQQQRAKLDTYDNSSLFVMHVIHYHSNLRRVDSDELDIFIGPNYLVTIHQIDIPPLDAVHRRWELARLPQEAAAYLFYLIVDGVVDSYFPIVDDFGELIDTIDAQIFTQPDRLALDTMFTARRNLLGIRKRLGPLRDALNELIRLSEEGQFFSLEQTRAYLNDVYDHVLRLTDFVDTYRDMLSGSLDAYQSALANKLNNNMQNLTVAATVLATGTVITGFYGMNLRGMGINAHWSYSGHVVLLVLIVITLIELWLFRRRGWI